MCGYEQSEARKFAYRAASVFALWFGVAAVALAVAATPAEADKKRNPAEKSVEESIPDPANGEPLILVIALNDQTIDIYRGTSLLKSSKVSSGTRGYATMAGVFSILEKQRHHHSNMYSGAPMPWMQRLTWSGTALHGGVLPGYPASHGCVRVSFSFAPKLFRITNVGEHVVIGNHRITPTLITHPILFQPLPPIPQTEISSEGLESPDSGGSAQTAEANGLSEQTADDPAPPERTEKAPQGVESGSKAKERSSAPLRILVTRRTQRDRIISVQHTLAALGHLKPQKFTGRLGKETIAAIKAFQRANGLRETGEFNDELAKEIYRAAGKAEPPEGHLFVRQNFRPLFDVPVAVRDPEQTLGTHVFIALNFAAGETTTRWMGMSLERDDAATVLDRIHIPDDMRQKISERLTPGSSLIIGDRSINPATLPKGADFLVLTADSPAMAAKPPAKVKQAKLKKTRSKPSKWRRSARTYAYDNPRRFDRPRFFRWRRW